LSPRTGWNCEGPAVKDTERWLKAAWVRSHKTGNGAIVDAEIKGVDQGQEKCVDRWGGGQLVRLKVDSGGMMSRGHCGEGSKTKKKKSVSGGGKLKFNTTTYRREMPANHVKARP